MVSLLGGNFPSNHRAGRILNSSLSWASSSHILLAQGQFLLVCQGISCLTLAHLVSKLYSKEPKNDTAFDLFTFFRTDLIQSEVSWKLSSTFDWLMSAWKNVSKKIHLSRTTGRNVFRALPKSALRLSSFFFLLVHVLTQLLLKLSRRGEKNALTVTLRVCLRSYKYKLTTFTNHSAHSIQYIIVW